MEWIRLCVEDLDGDLLSTAHINMALVSRIRETPQAYYIIMDNGDAVYRVSDSGSCDRLRNYLYRMQYDV